VFPFRATTQLTPIRLGLLLTFPAPSQPPGVPCNQHPPSRSLRRLRPHLQPKQRLSSTILVGWSLAWPAPLGWLWRSVGLALPSAARPRGAPVSCSLNFIN